MTYLIPDSTTAAATPGSSMPGSDTRNPQYQALKGKLHQDLLNRLNLERLTRVSRAEAEPEIRQVIQTLLERENQRVPLSLFDRENLVQDVLHELFGLGPLELLLQDPSISDILVNKASQVYIEREGKIEETDIVFRDDKHLMQIIERIVSAVGRRIDESTPMVDARLQDGSRVNVIIPPLALDGPAMSIRRFRTDKLGSNDLVERESLTQPMLDFLRGAVAARMNIIVSGGTGAGKTTLLNVLSSFIGGGERVVTIEDAAELTLRQRHVVRLETRPPNIEGKGAVRQRQLVINALRMRPDRIVVGEVRGEEALDMLQAMNTGHDGSLTTIHANSPRDALYRLDTMVAMANLNIPDKAIRQQVASAVNLVVQVNRMSDGTRKVTSISEITGMEQDVITMQEIFSFTKAGLDAEGRVMGAFRATGIRPKCATELATVGFELPMEMFEHVQPVNMPVTSSKGQTSKGQTKDPWAAQAAADPWGAR
jgi:pilus assembly protein CpaF